MACWTILATSSHARSDDLHLKSYERTWILMTRVTAQMSISLDGFYAGPKQADLHDWLNGTEAAGFMRVTRWVIDAMSWRERLGYQGGEQNTNSEIIAETFVAAGAYV